MSWIDTVLSEFAFCPGRWVCGRVPTSHHGNPCYHTVTEHWHSSAARPCTHLGHTGLIVSRLAFGSMTRPL